MVTAREVNSIEARAAGIELAKITLEMLMPISRRQFCAAVGAGLSVANANLFADDPKPKPLRVIAFALSDHLPQLAVFDTGKE